GVWDVATGRLIGEPTEFTDARLSAVACTVLDGRPIAVLSLNNGIGLGSGSGRVVVWDVATGRLIGEPTEFTDARLSAVACTVLDDRPIAVISGRGLTVWDLRVGKLLQHLAVPHPKDVEVAHDGSLVAILGRDIAAFRHRSDRRTQ
ncbi:hypothetical protein ACFW93_49560, partial [Streptomyces canus]